VTNYDYRVKTVYAKGMTIRTKAPAMSRCSLREKRAKE
jgi:hypothetical protein